MKFEDITLSDLNFVIGAVDFLIYDVPDSVSQRDIDTIATIIDTVVTNSQEQNGFNYKYLQNCVNRWRKEIETYDQNGRFKRPIFFYFIYGLTFAAHYSIIVIIIQATQSVAGSCSATVQVWPWQMCVFCEDFHFYCFCSWIVLAVLKPTISVWYYPKDTTIMKKL